MKIAAEYPMSGIVSFISQNKQPYRISSALCRFADSNKSELRSITKMGSETLPIHGFLHVIPELISGAAQPDSEAAAQLQET